MAKLIYTQEYKSLYDEILAGGFTQKLGKDDVVEVELLIDGTINLAITKTSRTAEWGGSRFKPPKLPGREGEWSHGISCD